MRTFRNSFKYGYTSEGFSEAMLKGDLAGLKQNSLSTCVNGTPIGYQGIQQRIGYELGFILTLTDAFVSFEVAFANVPALTLIARDKIILIFPDIKKYFITPLAPQNQFDITSITNVAYYTSGNQIFIGSARGIDVYSIKSPIASVANGSDNLKKEDVAGMTSQSLGSVTADVYGITFSGLMDNKAKWYGRFIEGGFASSIYIQKKAGLKIGDKVTFTVPFYYCTNNSFDSIVLNSKMLTISGIINREIQTQTFIVNGRKFVNNLTQLPPPLTQKSDLISRGGTNTTLVSFQNFNYPSFQMESFFGIDVMTSSGTADLLIPQNFFAFPGAGAGVYNIAVVFENLASKLDSIAQQLTARYNRTVALYGNKGTIGGQYRGVQITTQNTQPITAPNTVIQVIPEAITGGENYDRFQVFLSANQRLYLAWGDNLRFSELGKYTNFANGTDNLTATSPLKGNISGIRESKWIYELRERGAIFGTDKGIYFLDKSQTALSAAIIKITDTVPATINPVSCTINTIGGVVFISQDRSKVLFLASQAIVVNQTPILDLTEFNNAFQQDKIKKIISVSFFSGEMTMILTDSGAVWRLITGGSDKFGWTQDTFAFPVYDITSFNKKLCIFFNVSTIPSVAPFKAFGIFNLDKNTTIDLHTSILPLDYVFSIPDNTIISSVPNKQIYFVDELHNTIKQAILSFSEMILESHYEEYIGSRGSSKTLNRQIIGRIVNGENMYDVTFEYVGLRKAVNQNQDWVVQNDAKKVLKKTDSNFKPLPISGDIEIRSSMTAKLLKTRIRSKSLKPVLIKSEEYSIDFIKI